MFPDSDIARNFQCGKDKIAYIIKWGIAEFVKKELISKVTGPFILMFDESLNRASKKKQLDLHVRYWDGGQVQSRYLGSQFLGHATANDLLKEVKECAGNLDLSKLLSFSMDGPNVNLKFFDLFQAEYADLYGGSRLISVGSCGLHTLHNAFKSGFSAWNLDKLLRAFHTIFNNVPARREDYIKTTKSTRFPLAFCGHRWLENLPVVERALEIWPYMLLYTNAVRTKELPHPGTASFDVIEDAQKDPLALPKLQFFRSVAQLFDPFLKKYQTEEPVMPYLGKDLAELIKSLMRRFVKREVLQDITTVQLTNLDLEKETLMAMHSVDIGLGAEEALKGTPFSSSLMLCCPGNAGMKTSSCSSQCKKGSISSCTASSASHTQSFGTFAKNYLYCLMGRRLWREGSLSIKRSRQRTCRRKHWSHKGSFAITLPYMGALQRCHLLRSYLNL
ncbi:uncharacterized protein LOC121197645 [Toxotes jaculatrix]|uniref:uncharacterized protein LOC121197645 n=1 Tax=Toxotes jaculatrix TaxID=941984 RepID=UPI001B3ACF35|nr:uncharacterized protein LOC121197645 [Toxotes jaculatrix]